MIIEVKPDDKLVDCLDKIKKSTEKDFELREKGFTFLSRNHLDLFLVTELAKRENKNIQFFPWLSSPQKKKPTFSLFRSRRMLFLLLPLFVLAILSAAGFFLYYYLPQAKITLYFQRSSLSKTFETSFNPNVTNPDSQSLTIPAQIIKAEEEEDREVKATGKKIIGSKAQGLVTLQNWTDSELIFSLGTTISTEGGDFPSPLVFLLKEQVVVGKKTSTIAVPTPGTRTTQDVAGLASVEVEAAEIGDNYNLAVGTTFTISGKTFSQVSVIAENNFAGGTTKEITVFSQEDKNLAIKEMTKILQEKALKDLRAKVLGDQKIIEDSIQYKILKSTFNREVGSEVTSATGQVSLLASIFTFSESQLKGALEILLQESRPENLTLLKEAISYSLEEGEMGKEGIYRAPLRAQVSLIPAIDINSLKSQLLGVRVFEVQDTLKSVTELSRYTLELWPRLPSFLEHLPYLESRLTIEIEEDLGS